MENSTATPDGNPQKLKVELPHDQTVLGIYPKELKSGCQGSTWPPVVLAALFTVVTARDERGRKSDVDTECTTIQYKKEENPTTGDSVGQTWRTRCQGKYADHGGTGAIIPRVGEQSAPARFKGLLSLSPCRKLEGVFLWHLRGTCSS